MESTRLKVKAISTPVTSETTKESMGLKRNT